MDRNAYQMLRDVELLLDKVKAKRFDNSEVARALNFGVDYVLRDRIDNIKLRRDYSVQSAQRVRDELYPIVKAPATIVPSSNLVALPADYMMALIVKVTTGSDVYYAKPITYEELADIDTDDFAVPTSEFPKYAEDEGGIRLYTGSTNASSVDLTYIHEPAPMVISDDNTASGSLVNGTRYAVDSGTVTYDGSDYAETEDFVATATTTFSGGTVIEIVNTELPQILYDEIIYKAAAILEGTMEDLNKNNLLENEVNRS